MNTISAYELGILVARNNVGMQKLAQMPPSAPAPKPMPNYFMRPSQGTTANLNQAYGQISASQSPAWLTKAYPKLTNVQMQPTEHSKFPLPAGQRSYISDSRVPIHTAYSISGINPSTGATVPLGRIESPNATTAADINPSNVLPVAAKAYLAYQQGQN